MQREVEAVMTPAMDLEGGHSMEWFFEQWVRGTGIPHYRVEFTIHHTDKGDVVRGKLFQNRCAAFVHRRVPLYANTSAGHNVYLGTVVAAGPETSFHFTTLDRAAQARHRPSNDASLHHEQTEKMQEGAN